VHFCLLSVGKNAFFCTFTLAGWLTVGCSIVDTARKKGRILAAYHKHVEEITPRTAIFNFAEVSHVKHISSVSDPDPGV
jgi:hypothetical protein